MKRILLITFFILDLLILVRIAIGGQVSLAWDDNDPEPNGYRIFMRQKEKAYDYLRPDNGGVCSIPKCLEPTDIYGLLKKP